MTDETRKKGKPHADTFKPTEAQRSLVAIAVACGMPQREIVKKIVNPATRQSISIQTLKKCFKDELAEGLTIANAQVAQNMYRYASTRNNQAVIAGKFWLTHKGNWKPAVAEATDSSKITIEVVNRLGDE